MLGVPYAKAGLNKRGEFKYFSNSSFRKNAMGTSKLANI
jgi:hypothetical protein